MDEIESPLLSFLKELLSSVDIKINGTRPWDAKMNNPAIVERVIQDFSLGLGEGYMDGWWDCESLDEFTYRLTKHRIDKLQPRTINDMVKLLSDRIFNYRKGNIFPIRIRDLIKILSIKFFNFQTRTLAWEVNEVHYNLGNDLFERMLGPHMQYSCGYWKNATTFEESEEGKVRLICEKLHLEPGMRVLDIGCGFGGLAKYMAKNYCVSVTGVTLSSEQQKYGEKLCEGLDVRILLKDYRDLEGLFDRIVTVEMIEHVGPKNYGTFFSVVDRCLHPDGLFLLHVIGSNEGLEKFDDWVDKYIFPNMSFPSLSQIATASEPYFIVEDVHNFGACFDKTMMAWRERFVDAWPHISHNYNERFKRMFIYYLSLAAGACRSRRMQLWHIVFSRGIEGGVQVPR